MSGRRKTLTRTTSSSSSDSLDPASSSHNDMSASAMDVDDASEQPAASTPPTSVGDDRSTHSTKAGNEVGEPQDLASGGRSRRSRVSINYNVKQLLDAQVSEEAIMASSSKTRKASALSGRTLVDREESEPDELENEDIDMELEDDLEQMLARTPQKGKAPAKMIERRPSMTARAKKAASVLGKRTRDMVEAGKKKLGLVEEEEEEEQQGSPKKTKLLKELDTGPRGVLDEIDLDVEFEAPRPMKRARTTKAPQQDLAPVTIANPMQKTSSGRDVKKWQVQGLYAGQGLDFDPNKPASKQKKRLQKNRPESSASGAAGESESKPKKRHLNFNLPMFGYLDEDKTRSFRIPYDIYAPHNNKKMDEKPKDWHKLNKNRLVGDAKDIWQKEEKLQPSFCSCKKPDQPGTGCDDHCLNRVMQYECDDKNCKLGDDCSNRPFYELATRFKKGGLFDIGVEVVKTEQRGHGIRAARSFKPGQIIMEYTGEIITEDECQHRMSTAYLNKPCYYLMEMERGLVLDGTKGSAARFINHSCDPNCEVRMTKVNGVPRMGIYAGPSGIMTNEELSYDYNFDNFGDTRQTCYCGSQNCRGYLGRRLRADEYKKLAKEEQERLRISYEEAQKRAQQEARKKREHDERGSGWRGWLAIDDPEVKAKLKEEKRLKEEAEKNSVRAQRLAARRGSLSARPAPTPPAPKPARKKAEPKQKKAVDIQEEVTRQITAEALGVEEESDEDMKVEVVKKLSRPKHTRTTSTASKFTEDIDAEDRPASKASSRPPSRHSGITKKTTVTVKTSCEMQRSETLDTMEEDPALPGVVISGRPSLADELSHSHSASLSKISSKADTTQATAGAVQAEPEPLITAQAPKEEEVATPPKRSHSVRDRVKKALTSVTSGTKSLKQSTLNFAKLSP